MVTVASPNDRISALRYKYILKKGKGRFFSAAGGLQLAVRQSCSFAAAYNVCISMAMDVHGTTVSAWQVRFERVGGWQPLAGPPLRRCHRLTT